MPSAKVVQRDAHAQELQACQQQLRLRRVEHGVGLDDFHIQQAVRHGVALQLFLH